jgi:hypothetical protein
MIAATRRLILLTAGVVFLGFVVATSVSAVTFNKTMYFRFSSSVALPGVVLPGGEYVFELADPMTSRSVVRVQNRQRSQLFLQAIARRIARHPDVKGGTLKLGEAVAGAPRRILVWYPEEDSLGYEFIY